MLESVTKQTELAKYHVWTDILETDAGRVSEKTGSMIRVRFVVPGKLHNQIFQLGRRKDLR